MPTARAEIGVAALDGKIYVVGGTAQGRWDSPLNYEYDPATDHWRERAPLPRGLSHVGLVGLNGKLYAFGGFTNIVHVGAMNLAYVYDPASDSWKPIALLARPGVGRRGRGRRENPHHRRSRPRQSHRQHSRGIRSGDRSMEQSGATAAGA